MTLKACACVHGLKQTQLITHTHTHTHNGLAAIVEVNHTHAYQLNSQVNL